MTTRKLLLLFIPIAALLMVALLWQSPDDVSVAGIATIRPVVAGTESPLLPSLPDPSAQRGTAVEELFALDDTLPGARFGDDAAAGLLLGQVTGQLVDRGGKPVANEPVLLVLERDAWSRRPGRPGDRERPRQLVASTQSDEDGRFTLPARAGVRNELLAGGTTWARSTVAPVQAGEDLRVVLSEGQQLEGSVVDAASGAAVAGAWVLGVAPADAVMTRTDEGGHFRLGPLPDENTLVGAWAPGYDVKLQAEVLAALGPLTLELPEGREIKGRVMDRITQQPVTTGGTLTLTVDVMARMAGGASVATLPVVAQTFTATLDADGAFAFPPGPSMGFDIATKADGYIPDSWDRAESRPVGGDDDVIIALWPLGTVSGRVLRDGSPAGNITVSAAGPNGGFFKAVTGSDGTFAVTLDGWDGERPVHVEAHDATGTLGARARLGRPEEEQVLELVPALSLAVQVVRGGEPVVGAEVAALSQRSDATIARSGADGLLTLTHLLAGPDTKAVRLQARSGDSESLPLDLDLSKPLPSPPFVLDLDGGAFIEGSVGDPFGNPVASAAVTFRPSSGGDDLFGGGRDDNGNRDDRDDRDNRGNRGNRGPGSIDFSGDEDDGGPSARWITGRTDPAGHFRLGPMPADLVGTLVVRARDFRDRSIPDVAAGEQSVPVQLDPVVRWTGRVVNLASGQPLKDFHVLLEREELDGGRAVFKNTRDNVERTPGVPGEFSVSLPERGRYQLRVSASDSISASSFPVDFNGTDPPPFAVVGLSPAAVLELTVLDARGRPVAGFGVAAIAWGLASGADNPSGDVRKGAKETRTNGAGQARFALGEGGSYRIAGGPSQWLDGQRLDVKPGKPVSRTITLPATGDLEVTLIDEQGRPLAGVRVDVRSARTDKSQTVSRQTGARTLDGKVLIEGLPPGDYDVYCRRRGYDTQKKSVLVAGNVLVRLSATLLPKQP